MRKPFHTAELPSKFAPKPADWEASDGIPAPEEQDPVMDKVAAGLREILAKMPRRTHIRRVGWGWWYELQGVEPEPEEEPEFDASDIWSLRDWFDYHVEKMFSKEK